MTELEIRRDVQVEGVDAQGVRATFYTRSIHHKARSDEEGRPIYMPVIYYRVEADAENRTAWDLPLKPEQWYVDNSRQDPRERWEGAWARFKEGASGKVEGTPLSSWAYLPDHRVRELNALGILSLEQLAHLPDKRAGSLGPDGISIRDGAKKFLQPADVHTQGLQQENAKLRQEMATLRSEFEQLQKQKFGEEDGAPPPKRGGWPKGKPRKPAGGVAAG